MENCYVLFVRTCCEDKIAHRLKERLEPSLFLPFIPVKEKFFRKNGKTKKEYELCFQSYVFIESELVPDEFIIELLREIRACNDIYRIVNYGEKRDIAMRDSERIFLKRLYGVNNCIESSIGFIEGDKIKVTEGPLAGMESSIKTINRHKREAVIEIDFMGSLRQITLGLEIIARI